MTDYLPPEELTGVPLGGNDATTQAMLMAMLGLGGTGQMSAPLYNEPQLQSLMGMVPTQNPSGSPLTASTQANVLQDWSSLLFDPAMAAFAGPQAYGAEAFEPTTTTSVVQSPELQRIYGYLRDPTSLEGMIATELQEGGTARTAIRKIRQFMADPTLTSEADLELKNRLALELPPVFDSITNQPAEVTPEGGGIDWRQAQEDADVIGNEWAGIPVLGPTGTITDAQGNVISEGGERMWGTDPDTGAPVMLEVQSKPSPLGKKFEQLGLPSPYDEYTPEDFMTPEQVGLQQEFAEFSGPQGPVEQAMADYLAAANQPLDAARVRPSVNRPATAGGDVEPGLVTAAEWEPPMLGEEPERLYSPAEAQRAAQAATVTPYTPDQGIPIALPTPENPVTDQLFDNQISELAPYVANPDQSGQYPRVDAVVGNRAADYGWTPEQTAEAITRLNAAQQASIDASAGGGGGGGPTGYAGQAYVPGGGAAVAAMIQRMLAPKGGEEPPPGPLTTEQALTSPLADLRTQRNVALGGDFATGEFGGGDFEPSPRPPMIPPNQGGFNLDLNFTPTGALAGPPGYTDEEDYARAVGLTRAGMPTAPVPPMPIPPDERRTRIYQDMYEEWLRGGGQPTGELTGAPDRRQQQAEGWPSYTRAGGQVVQTGPTPRDDWLSAQILGGQVTAPYAAAPPVYTLPTYYTGERERSSGPPQSERATRRTGEEGQRVYPSSEDVPSVRQRGRGAQVQRRNRLFREWDLLTDEQQRLRQRSHTFDTGYALGTAMAMRQQGVTPLQQVLMARRMTLMGAGMPSSGYVPGT